MKKIKKSKAVSSENNAIKAYLKEQIVYISINIIIFIICCTIALISSVSETKIQYFSIGTFVVSALLCGYISGFKHRKNGITVGIKSVSLSTVLIILISLVSNRFDISIIKTVTSITLIIAFGIIGGIAGVNTRIKPKKRVK